MVIDVPEIIFENQLATFNCSAAGVGVVQYSWARDGVSLPGSNASQLTENVSLSWDGSCLSCHVEAENEEVVNASSTLQVFSKTSPTNTNTIIAPDY